jgi:uncharacterized membrane protein
MNVRALLVVTLGALASIALARPAAAEFAVCNSASHGTVHVAWAATWNDSQGKSYGESQGWWEIPEEDCKIMITNDISSYTLFIYAYADSDSSIYWGGDTSYCLDPTNKFAYHGDAMDTPCSSGKAFGLRSIDTGNQETYTYYLRD